jgi:tRNA pseudouridine55 synthase
MAFLSVEMTPGIYLVHKQVGETSFSLVGRFMDEVRAAGIRRDKLPVCHGGALDPFAEGLVLLLAGQATRLMDLLHPIPKSYVAEIAWGVETDNGDLLGKPVAQGDASRLTPETLDSALPLFLGFRDQVPPLTSNKRVDGERAYRKAHRGEVFELPPSRVYLHSARFVAHDLPRSSTLELTSRGGYYVRSLARDLGRAVGALGHLTRLRRTAIGPWLDPPPGQRAQIRGVELYPWCASREVTPSELAALRSEKPISRGEIAKPPWSLPQGFPDPEAPIRALSHGQIVAMLREREGALWPAPVLRAPL